MGFYLCYVVCLFFFLLLMLLASGVFVLDKIRPKALEDYIFLFFFGLKLNVFKNNLK